ncbi:MAG: DUF3107 domain-containing protein [Acidimicrobiia bacterium]|nr:DUF3107 domain-containing protein [Acidimicrobiia bacterium]
MNVRIGVLHTPKELDIEMPDETDGGELRADIEVVLSSGDGVLWLTDKKGRQVGVPVERIAYVDVGPDSGGTRIGFGS